MDLAPLRRRPGCASIGGSPSPEVALNPLTAVRAALRTTGSSARLVWDDRGLRRVHLALLGSSVGDGAYATALAVWTFAWGGATALGAYLAVKLVLKALTVPLLVALAARRPRRTVLVVLDAVRAVLVAAVAVVVLVDGAPVLVLVLAGLTGVVGAPFRPVSAALVPSLAASPRALTAANGMGSTLESVAGFVGPALGGLVLATSSVATVFLLDVLTFAWSAVLLLGLHPRDDGVRPPAGPVATPGDARPGLVEEVAAGFGAIGADRRLRLVVGLACLRALVVGAATVFTVVVALEVVGLGPPGVGYLTGAVGVGAVAGGLVALGRAGRGTAGADLVVGLLAWTLPFVALALTGDPVVALVVFFLSGVGDPLAEVNLVTLLQRLAPGRALDRVLGALESATLAAVALGALVTAPLLTALGPRTGLVVIVVPVAAVALACLPALHRLDHGLRPPAALGLVVAQPLFAGLAPSVQELLAQRLRPLVVTAGTEVVREGEPGDAFYLVETGRLEARRGTDLLSVMGAGDCFGEIALLRDVPRTADVVALEDSLLQVLDRADFLSAVGADPETAARADLLVSTRLAR